MFYCTIYKQQKLSDKSTREVFLSLSYLDKADAEKYQQSLVQQAIDMGGRTNIDGSYITLSGKILLQSTGITNSRRGNHYCIGIESDSTKFSIIPTKAKALIPAYKTTDGIAYEIYAEDAVQHRVTEFFEKQTEVNNNTNKFAEEIAPMTDLWLVLRSFVRFYNQKTDKEKLAAIITKKLQEIV